MAPWAPTDDSTLRAWWHAPDLAQADASAVSSWLDRSGNTYTLTQGVSGNRPTYKTGIQNGLDVVRFDGSSDALVIASALGLSTQPFTTVGVWQMGSGNDQILIQTTTPFASHGINGGALRLYNGSWAGAAITKSAWRLTVGVHNGASSLVAIDGASPTTINPGTGGWGGTTVIGAAQDGLSAWLNGDIGAVLVFNSALNTDTRQKLEGYLAHQWGLDGNLPSDHPYKAFAPGARPARSGLRYALGTGLRNRTLRS